MKVTIALKNWLAANAGLKPGATDEEVKSAATAELFKDGTKLDGALLAELTKDADGEKASGLESKLDGLLDTLTKQAAATTAPPAQSTGPSALEKAFAGSEGTQSGTPAGSQPRVKGAHEFYDGTKRAASFPDRLPSGRRHPMAGLPLSEGGFAMGRSIDGQSDLDKAVSGSWCKYVILRETQGKGIPRQMQMTDHDKGLVMYALQNMKWGGVIGGDCESVTGSQPLKGVKLTELQQKAILDDSTSGGLEVAPIAFDDAIITIPLLNGEFFPRVNVVPITRGRRIEGATMGNVTLTSGGADGTDIPLFNTASFIAAFDTTIFVVNGAIEIGLDFLSDSPIDVASMVTGQYGQVLLTWLDEQICIGDGTTEPEGIMNASGTTNVAGGSAAPTIGIYENFLFGVPKAYKQGFSSDRIVFGATEETYQRARAIAVSGSDARRLFGMTHEDYMLFGHPYGINEAMSNTQAFFANLGRYRMYRRMGLTLKVTTEGKTLVRLNQMLLTARARYGGQLEDGAAAATSSTMQA